MTKITISTQDKNFPLCKVQGSRLWVLTWDDLQTYEGLYDLDAAFKDWLQTHYVEVLPLLEMYRQGEYTRKQQSQFILELAPIVEKFWVECFMQQVEYARLQDHIAEQEPVLAFRKWAVRGLKEPPVVDEALWLSINALWENRFQHSTDHEALVAEAYMASSEEEKERLLMWLSRCVAMRLWGTEHWQSLVAPEKIDWDSLFPVRVDDAGIIVHVKSISRPLDFEITDHGKDLRAIQMEADYCLYCHKNSGDSCSVGFLRKKHEPAEGVKANALGDPLWGCPLDQHISEMNLLRRRGLIFAALATIMVENPLCCLTGYRICNDCSMACIYQKQKPVDIPSIETRIVKDILGLTWGAEWYMLLLAWNPLRSQQYLPKLPKNKHVVVAGLGPSGIAVMYHLWMEGTTCVGFDGLTVQHPPHEYMQKPLAHMSQWWEPLGTRTQKGFGGVAEYGITVRWDKNFLTLPWVFFARWGLSFYGGIRLGGTITIDDVWAMGFDHMVWALGAGLPIALNIPGSLAKGMRAANDFLMNLQLQGANHRDAITLMDIRLPGVVIGGGLTSVDAATELQAYYIHLIRRVHHMVKALCDVDETFWMQWTREEREVLEEWLEHASWLEHGMEVNTLLQRLGGVTIVYRRELIASPSYRSNAHELDLAMRQGIRFLEHHVPSKIYLDAQGRVASMALEHVTQNTIQHIPARTILLAIGSQPNVAYEYEHAGTLVKSHNYYTAHHGIDPLEADVGVQYTKNIEPGMMTSYNKGHYRISYVGDLHPVFHGSVVKALASAKKAYKAIVAVLEQMPEQEKPACWSMPYVQSMEYIAPKVLRITVFAPLHAQRALPGHFFRMHSYEQPRAEACPLTLFDVTEGALVFVVRLCGVSTHHISTLKPGDAVALMGPTGVRMRMDNPMETTLVLTDNSGLPSALAIALHMFSRGITVFIVCVVDVQEHCNWMYHFKHKVSGMFILTQKDRWIEDLMGQSMPFNDIQRVVIQGKASFLKQAGELRQAGILASVKNYIASVHGPMQCMLKGVCAQCWQWQIDPYTKKRTKPVFACSWQDQPLELIDVDHLEDRQTEGSIVQKLSFLYVNNIL